MELFDIPYIYLFLALLPIVAFMYAGVGHGGASGYLALMALFMFPPFIMKPTALLLNIFIAGVSFWAFKVPIKSRILKLSKILDILCKFNVGELK